MKIKNIIIWFLVGFDFNKNPKYANLLSIDGNYKGEISGSKKKYSFQYIQHYDLEEVHVFESSIDLLSYASLLKYWNKDWYKYNLLSLGGISIPPKKKIIIIYH